MPLSLYQVPLHDDVIQTAFNPVNSSVFILYADGTLTSVSPEGKDTLVYCFKCEPVSFRINTTGDLIAVLAKEKLYFIIL